MPQKKHDFNYNLNFYKITFYVVLIPDSNSNNLSKKKKIFE